MSKAPLVFLLLLGATPQEDKKGPPDPKPRVFMALPLAISPGARVQVTLRGLNLDQASEVRFAGPTQGATIALKSKGKAESPKESDPAVCGNTQLDLELTLPESFPAAGVGLVAVSPKGEAAYELKVVAKDKLVSEKEPNGGFATAQAVEAGQTIQGSIGQAMDVDVFKISGKRGETWILDVEAQRRGSVLDGLLTLRDAGGHIVATSDDSESSRDPSLKVKLPKDGCYLITLIDANNSGGATHPYLLHVRRD